MTTITIATKRGPKTIEADVVDAWAIHPTSDANQPVGAGPYTLTHVPTGYKFLCTASRDAAEACRTQLLASKVKWTFTTPSEMTNAHRDEGRRLLKTYGDM